MFIGPKEVIFVNQTISIICLETSGGGGGNNGKNTRYLVFSKKGNDTQVLRALKWAPKVALEEPI